MFTLNAAHKVFTYLCVSFVGLLGGAVVGCIGGFSLGWLMALGYHRYGPSDPGDAPVYAALGLMMAGTLLGAIMGCLVGIIYSVRLACRKALG